MEIFDQIKKYKKEIDGKFLEIYPKGPNSLVEPINYVLNGGGKRLRPLLTSCCYKICKKNINNEQKYIGLAAAGTSIP